MKTRDSSKPQRMELGKDIAVDEASLERANIMRAAAKQRLRLAKQKYKVAWRLYKEAKQESKRLRRMVEKIKKALKRTVKGKKRRKQTLAQMAKIKSVVRIRNAAPQQGKANPKVTRASSARSAVERRGAKRVAKKNTNRKRRQTLPQPQPRGARSRPTPTPTTLESPPLQGQTPVARKTSGVGT